jgi:ABC-type antimicrobial peptide transport system permease subunit
MINHYIKIAVRNLLKYRGQTLISVVGLAVGFACFAMSALWIRYEMTYDAFHKNADRMYCVEVPNIYARNGLTRMSPYPLAEYLKATFPEIKNAVLFIPSYSKRNIEIDKVKHEIDMISVDSSFFSMFDVKIIEGNMNFLIPDSRNIAITRDKARQLFGSESPFGKTIKIDGDYTVCAVVTGLPKHSNYPFDVMSGMSTAIDWNLSPGHTIIETVPGADVDALKKKLSSHTIEASYPKLTKMILTPLTAVHYKDRNIDRNVQFQHIVIFSLSASLLIVCTLFNYLTLFVSRFRIRQREFALRTVYGASGRSLFVMLSTEFALSMIAALLLGMFLIYNIIEPFYAISETKMELSAIYFESAAYIAAIIVVALSAFVVMLAMFRRRTLNANIHGNKKILRKMSIVVQLIVSIVFAFCTIVILKQMYYLRNTDLGFSFKNRGSVYIEVDFNNIKALNYKIRQIPEIEETIAGYDHLLPASSGVNLECSRWDGKQEGAEDIAILYFTISQEYIRFYELKLAAGEMMNETWAANDVMINESAAKTFGWDTVVGKSFDGQKVRGMLKNIYNRLPTVSPQPYCYNLPERWRWTDNDGTVHDGKETPMILFRYHEGTWKICKEKIMKIVETEFPNTYISFHNDEEEYDTYLKSENTLIAMLTVISIICIIVCIFGFVSMVSLTCEERRKEIAIRKINGATVKDVLDLFFEEYLTLLAVGALIAFPAGYIAMRRWLEQYVVQTEISAWIYIAILLSLILIIVLFVGGKVYRTSRENPINAIK